MRTANSRILSAILAFAITISFLPGGLVQPVAVAAATSHNIGTGDLTISRGDGDFEITGTTDTHKVIVRSDYYGTITLKNVKIELDDVIPLDIQANANVTLILEGKNTLTADVTNGDHAYTALSINPAASLTINADSTADELIATSKGSVLYGAAGIGGQPTKANGTIVINNGKITATGSGGYYPGAGIGGGTNGAGGNITILGGEVIAKGGEYTSKQEAVSGSAGIGGGYLRDGGTITIQGGKVEATGGGKGPGIGGGVDGGTGTITITGGEITASPGYNEDNPCGVGIGSTSQYNSGSIFIGGKKDQIANPLKITVSAKSDGTTQSPAIGGYENLVILPFVELVIDRPNTGNDLDMGTVQKPTKIYYLNTRQTVRGLNTQSFKAYTALPTKDPMIDIYVRANSIPQLRATGAFIGSTDNNGPDNNYLEGLYLYSNVDTMYFSDEKVVNSDPTKPDLLVYGEAAAVEKNGNMEVELPRLGNTVPTYTFGVTGATGAENLVELDDLEYGYTWSQASAAAKTFGVNNTTDNPPSYMQVSHSSTYDSDSSVSVPIELSGNLVEEPGFEHTFFPAEAEAIIRAEPAMNLPVGTHIRYLTVKAEEGPEVQIKIQVTVLRIPDTANKAGSVTGEPEPNGIAGTPMTNTSVKLTATLDQGEYPGNTFDADYPWYYAITTLPNAPPFPEYPKTPDKNPDDIDPLWVEVPTATSDGTVTHVIDAAAFPDPPPDGKYYIHYRLETKNTTGTKGTVTATTGTDPKPTVYWVDAVAPITTRARANDETGSVSDDFDIWIDFEETNFPDASSFPNDFDTNQIEVINGSVGTISGPTNVNGKHQFVVTIRPDPGLGATEKDIVIKIKEGVVHDKASNPSAAVTDDLEVKYDARNLSADFEDGFGAVYPVAPDSSTGSFQFTVHYNNGTAGLTYKDSTNTYIPITSSNAKEAFSFTETDGGSTPVPDTDYDVTYTQGTDAGVFIIKPADNGSFGEGNYVVTIAEDGMHNAAGLGFSGGAQTASFEVRVPTITKIDPPTGEMPGEKTTPQEREYTFKIQGKNLKVNDDYLKSIDPDAWFVGVRRVGDGASVKAAYFGISTPAGEDVFTVTVEIPPYDGSEFDEKITHTYNVDLGGTIQTNDSAQATVDAKPAKTFRLSFENRRTDPLADLEYGYDPSELANQVQTIRLKNKGNQPLNNLDLTLSVGSGSFTLSTYNVDIPLSPGYVDIDVTPIPGLGAGKHEATLTVTGPNWTGSTNDPALELLPQHVYEADGSAYYIKINDETRFTKNPDRTLTMVPDSAANEIGSDGYAQWQITDSPDKPADDDTNWQNFVTNSPTADVKMGLPFNTTTTGYPDGKYYIHWRLKLTGYTGTSGSFEFDLDRAGAEVEVTSSNWVNNGKINYKPREVTFKFTDRSKTGSNAYTTAYAVGFDPDTELTASDFTTTNCSITAINTTVSKANASDDYYGIMTVVVTVEAPNTLPDNAEISIVPNLDSADDLAGNPITQPAPYIGYYDGTRPIAELSTPKLTVNSNFDVELEFTNKAVTTSAADIAKKIAIENGTLLSGSFTPGSPADQKFKFTVVPTTPGEDVKVSLPEDSAFDSALNGNTASNQLIVAYDNTAPKATLSPDNGKFNSTITINVELNKKVTPDLTGTNVEIDADSGTAPGNVTLTPNTATTYTLTFTTTEDTDKFTIKVPGKSGFEDEYGNTLADSNTITAHYDSVRPQIDSLTTARDKVNKEFEVKAVFNKALPDVPDTTILGAFAVTNGTAANIRLDNSDPSKQTYIVTINPIGTGEFPITVGMPENRFKDAFGNDNLISIPATLPVTFNDNKPTVTYSIENGAKFPRVLSGFTITADEELSDSATSWNVVGAAEMENLLDFNASFTASKSGTAPNIVFSIGSSFGPGQYTVSIPEDIFFNEFGNSLDASSRSFEVLEPAVESVSASPVRLPSSGGAVEFTVGGIFLDHIPNMEVRSIPLGGSSYPVGSFSTPYGETGTASATLPPAPTVEDVSHEFEVYADNKPTGQRVTVIVSGKGRPDIRGMEASPPWHPYTGGSSDIILTGQDLQNLPLSLTVSPGGETYDIPAGQVSADGTTASLQLGFSGNDSTTTNTVFTVEANVAGAPTGMTTYVVVGSFDRPRVFAPDPMELEHHMNMSSTGQFMISLGMSGETSPAAEYASVRIDDSGVATVARGSSGTRASVMAAMEAAAMEVASVSSRRVGTTTVHVDFYDFDGNLMSAYSDSFTVKVVDNYSYATDDGSGGFGGGMDGDNPRDPRESTWWIELPEAKELVNTAKEKEADKIPYRRSTITGIRKDAAHHMAGYTFYHDTIDEDRNVLLRIVLEEPEKVTHDTLLTGYVRGERVEALKSRFEEWFPNKLHVIRMEEQGSFGLRVELAAKLNMDGFDTGNLYFYTYDSETGTCTRIKDTGYWVDGKSFLHFYTEQAGDIIVSDGPLYGTDPEPASAADMYNPSSGGDGMNPNSPAFQMFLRFQGADRDLRQTAKGIGFTLVLLLAAAFIWAIVPRKSDKKVSGKK